MSRLTNLLMVVCASLFSLMANADGTATPHSIPFFDGFESCVKNDSVVGWSLQSDTTDEETDETWVGKKWVSENRKPYQGEMCAFLWRGNADWMFVPLLLEKNTDYVVSLYAHQDGEDEANITVMLGMGDSLEAMNTTLIEKTLIGNAGYQCLVKEFTIEEDGVYWLGILGDVDYASSCLLVDNVSVKKQSQHSVSIAHNDCCDALTTNKSAALAGDTVVVDYTMSGGCFFNGYSTSPTVTWLNDSSFIMPAEDVTIGVRSVATKEIPFFEGFESGNVDGESIVDWMLQRAEEDEMTPTWQANSTKTEESLAPYQGDWNAILSEGNNDWMLTPLHLEKDTAYLLSLFARQIRIDDSAFITVMLGTAADKDSLKMLVIDQKSVADGTYHRIVGKLSVEESGVYWLGILGYLYSEPNYLSLDNISVEKIAQHKIDVDNTYGTVITNKKVANGGDTIVIQNHQLVESAFFVGFTTSTPVMWTSDTSFVMPNEDVTIGLDVIVPRNVPFTESFESGNINYHKVGGWVQQSGEGDDESLGILGTWLSVEEKPRSGTWSACLFGRNIDWMFTPVMLEKDTTYLFDFYVRQDESSRAALSAKVGTAPDEEAMSIVVIDEEVVGNGEYQHLSGKFKVEERGVYWIGILSAVGENTTCLSIDDISLSQLSSETGVCDAHNPRLYVTDGRICCEGDFRICDLLGRDVTRMNGSLHGLYIVRIGNSVWKVMVE